MVGIKSSQTSMLSSKIKLTILYIINTFRIVLVTPKTHTNISRYFVLGNRLFIFLKIGLRSIFWQTPCMMEHSYFPEGNTKCERNCKPKYYRISVSSKVA